MNAFLKGILDGINSVLGNYGWSIMVFTLLIRIVLMPFDYKSRVSMRRMSDLQPQISALQKKYAKDQQKLNQKTSELYRKEHINPLSGCLPLLLSYPILIAMFGAMRAIANEQIVQQVLQIFSNPSQLPQFESWLWVRNIWMPDSPFAACLPDLNTLRQVPSDVWQKFMTADVIATLPGDLAQLTAESFTGNQLMATIQQIYASLSQLAVYQEATSILPGWTFNLLITTFSLMKEFNGLFLLPILSAVSQFAMTKIQPAQPQSNPDSPGASTGKFMTYFFPIFSLWICSSYNGAFALYWVTSNLIAMVQTYFINKIIDRKKADKQIVDAETSIR